MKEAHTTISVDTHIQRRLGHVCRSLATCLPVGGGVEGHVSMWVTVLAWLLGGWVLAWGLGGWGAAVMQWLS